MTMNKEYERGFKDGVKSEITNELSPMVLEIIKGVSDAVKSVIPLMVDRMEIKANLDSNDWIPCSERMPENDDRVLILAKNESVYIAKHRVFGHFVVSFEYWLDDKEVTHWMPLPEPHTACREYKGG